MAVIKIEKTNATTIIDSFESSFVDKHVIPKELELVWLEKAIGRYSVELEPLNYDSILEEFDKKLDRYVIDTLAQFMQQYYQERQVSLANKRVSIVTKGLSVDGSNGAKTAEKAHLEYIEHIASEMIENQKETAFV